MQLDRLGKIGSNEDQTPVLHHNMEEGRKKSYTNMVYIIHITIYINTSHFIFGRGSANWTFEINRGSFNS